MAMGKPETKLADLCAEPGITPAEALPVRQAKGESRTDGEKLLAGRKREPLKHAGRTASRLLRPLPPPCSRQQQGQ
ncbi:hypothetical protein DUT91_19140 [Phyllobacterium salinisoli]|uniref:Uncharacterized protein n=1 Tax=Phyllobacterium salinisoli TaxID=1899321 RepID=A0A368K2C1_9HYPH|nr:hypothetical protein DUT91_19140 [Phyllobacterium salinisoli]